MDTMVGFSTRRCTSLQNHSFLLNPGKIIKLFENNHLPCRTVKQGKKFCPASSGRERDLPPFTMVTFVLSAEPLFSVQSHCFSEEPLFVVLFSKIRHGLGNP